MNTNTFENLQSFLTDIINQLQTYNNINFNDLKTICFIEYQQRINYEEPNIKELLTIIFSLIKPNTNIYVLSDIYQPMDINTIFNSYLI